jgi:transcriptional regulator with XRE-family HTH domain
MITAKQSKAARALLNWNAKELANQAGVSPATITNFEKYQSVLQTDIHKKIISAYEKASIRFINDNGVELLQETSEILQGKNCIEELWKKILDSFKGHNSGEVLITHVDETRALDKSNGDLRQHIKNLEEHGISERLLSCEGDTVFLTNPECYRWLDKGFFTLERSTYVFNGCVAIQFWQSNLIVFIRNQRAFQAEKDRFEFLWENAKIPIVTSKQ